MVKDCKMNHQSPFLNMPSGPGESATIRSYDSQVVSNFLELCCRLIDDPYNVLKLCTSMMIRSAIKVSSGEFNLIHASMLGRTRDQ